MFIQTHSWYRLYEYTSRAQVRAVYVCKVCLCEVTALIYITGLLMRVFFWEISTGFLMACIVLLSSVYSVSLYVFCYPTLSCEKYNSIWLF